MDYPERAECDFTFEYAYGEQPPVLLHQAREERRRELLEFIEENQVEEVREFVMDAVRELLELKK